VVKSRRDKDKAGTFVVPDQLPKISSSELVTSQGRDIT